MPAVADARIPKNPLRSRLAGLRRRRRLVAAFRGAGLLLYVLLAVVVVGGLLDWFHPLPGLVRALFLVGGLAATGAIAFVYLFRPLSARTDDLTLALQVEEHYPGLNDSLASAVQFLEEGDAAGRFGSPALQREALRDTLRKTHKLDFNKAVDVRGLLPAGLAGAGALSALVLLFWLSPAAATTALLRLADPFGGREWPRKTQIEVLTPPGRIARGQPYTIEARVRGFLPEHATLRLWYDNTSPTEDTYDLPQSADGTTGLLRVDLSRLQTQGSFRYQVVAHDAVSEWVPVTVVPPPVLVALDGKASPQVRLEFPTYTDLPARDLPEGTGDIVAVAGTSALLRAAADRPLKRAWIEYHPDLDQTDLLAFLEAVGTSIPAQLDASRQVFEVRFRPRFHGSYVLHLEDEDQVQSSQYYDVHVTADPSPTVTLTHPEPGRTGLLMLADADLTLTAQLRDKVFAVRSATLEYRCNRAGGPNRLPLYDATWTPALLALAPSPATPLPSAWRARLQFVAVDQRLSLKSFRRPGADVPGLQLGDVLILHVEADDFDDVTIHKPAGRSHDIEIHIVDRNALEVALAKQQARVQQELVRLHDKERQAIEQVNKAAKTLEVKGALDADAQQQLEQAEQLQKEIREAVGNKESGLRADVDRLQQTARDNHLPSSAMNERIDDVAAELDRLAQSELGQVEPPLNAIRKRPETATPAQRDDVRQKLTEASRHQQEVERSLDALLARLEPVSNALEYKGEAKSILQEQRELLRRTRELETLGKTPEELSPDEKLELEKLKDAQNQLMERMKRLHEKMERKAKADPGAAKEMDNALKVVANGKLESQMGAAREQIQKNQLSGAAETQKQTAAELEKLVKELEDRRELELDRLSKRFKELEDEVAKLARDQETLTKKIKDTAGNPDLSPKQKEDALKRLAREQQDLQKKADEIKENLRQLSRLRAERAGEAVARASERMEQNAGQLERGQQPAEQPEDALDRLDEARRELAKARNDAEEELAREQLAKVADQIRNLKTRQESLLAESKRLQSILDKEKIWGRKFSGYVSDLAENQKGLGTETAALAEKRLAGAIVFARVLSRAGQEMEQASEDLKAQIKRSGDTPNELALDPTAVRSQQQALRLLDQLLEVLKPEPGVARRPADGQQAGGGEQPGGGQNAGKPRDSDAIPDILQLKLLRALQAEVNRRTEDFARQHPDRGKLTDDDRNQLQEIRKQQEEVADLLEKLTVPPGAEGGPP